MVFSCRTHSLFLMLLFQVWRGVFSVKRRMKYFCRIFAGGGFNCPKHGLLHAAVLWQRVISDWGCQRNHVRPKKYRTGWQLHLPVGVQDSALLRHYVRDSFDDFGCLNCLATEGLEKGEESEGEYDNPSRECMTHNSDNVLHRLRVNKCTTVEIYVWWFFFFFRQLHRMIWQSCSCQLSSSIWYASLGNP